MKLSLYYNIFVSCSFSFVFLATSPSCPAFKLSQHLVMNISDNSRVVGTKVTFSCEPGYLLDGSEVVTCIKNGVWSDEMPKCTGELVVSTSAKICPESEQIHCCTLIEIFVYIYYIFITYLPRSLYIFL